MPDKAMEENMRREVEEFLSAFPFADTTKDTYRRVLVQLVELDLDELSAAGLIGFVCRPGWGSNQRYTALCACRKFISWQYGREHPALAADLRRIPTKPQPRLSKEQVYSLLGSFEDGVASARDRAIVAVALDCNLRATELCNLELGNVDLDGLKLFALVKGGQWAWKVFSPVAGDFIRAWIEVRPFKLGVPTLFVSFQQQHFGEALTREGLQGIMRRWGERVGFHVSPHMFRRSYASQSTLAGAPKNVVKAGGGWKSDRMVDRYIGDLELEVARPYLPLANLQVK